MKAVRSGGSRMAGVLTLSGLRPRPAAKGLLSSTQPTLWGWGWGCALAALALGAGGKGVVATSLGPEGAELRDGSWGVGMGGEMVAGWADRGAPLPTAASSEAIQAPAPTPGRSL